ncbi:MAG: hypothetical protein L6Q35_01455 [Phycisphaerales bacterium]|nr:hypothetical protein [Phycisphaerales bacterium]
MGESARNDQLAEHWNSVPGTVSVHPSWIDRSTSLRDATVFVALAGAMAVVWLFTRERWWIVGSAILLVIAQVVAVVALTTRRGALAAGRSALEQTVPDSWEAIAIRAWIKSRLRTQWWWFSDPRAGLDETEWFDGAPTQASTPRPRVVFCRCRIEHSRGGDEVQEPTEVGAMRRMTPQERRRRQRQFIWMSVAAAAFLIPIVSGSASPRFWGVWAVFQLLAVAYRLGWGPFHINSAIAAVRSLEVVRWGSHRAYTTDDSVLVVEPAGAATASLGRGPNTELQKVRPGNVPILVHAVRRDGTRSTLNFDHDSDPGLSDLLARWLEATPVPSAAAREAEVNNTEADSTRSP